MYGISNFAAIINPPQAGILACGNAEPKVVLDKNGQPKQVWGTNDCGELICMQKQYSPQMDQRDVSVQVMVMNATMSCDHRVVDGAVGATWLQAFRALIENPERLML